MKNRDNNSSFFKASSLCLILSCFVINNFRCEASDGPREEMVEEGSNSTTINPSTIAVSGSGASFQEPTILELQPIAIPTSESLKGNNFWPELLSLAESDTTRDYRRTQGQNAFLAVVKFPRMFEDFDYGTVLEGVNFREALSKKTVKAKIIINNQELEINQFNDMLFDALVNWPDLKDCFFSLNRTVTEFRKRVRADYERQHKLVARLSFLEQMKESWRQELLASSKKIIELEQSSQVLSQENLQLRARITQLEREAAENARQPVVDDVAIPMDPPTSRLSFWGWIKSWFGRNSLGEKQRLL